MGLGSPGALRRSGSVFSGAPASRERAVSGRPLVGGARGGACRAAGRRAHREGGCAAACGGRTRGERGGAGAIGPLATAGRGGRTKAPGHPGLRPTRRGGGWSRPPPARRQSDSPRGVTSPASGRSRVRAALPLRPAEPRSPARGRGRPPGRAAARCGAAAGLRQAPRAAGRNPASGAEAEVPRASFGSPRERGGVFWRIVGERGHVV